MQGLTALASVSRNATTTRCGLSAPKPKWNGHIK
jgi:hypothetical protein